MRPFLASSMVDLLSWYRRFLSIVYPWAPIKYLHHIITPRTSVHLHSSVLMWLWLNIQACTLARCNSPHDISTQASLLLLWCPPGRSSLAASSTHPPECPPLLDLPILTAHWRLLSLKGHYCSNHISHFSVEKFNSALFSDTRPPFYPRLPPYGSEIVAGPRYTPYSDISEECILVGPQFAWIFTFSDRLLTILHAIYLVSNKVV